MPNIGLLPSLPLLLLTMFSKSLYASIFSAHTFYPLMLASLHVTHHPLPDLPRSSSSLNRNDAACPLPPPQSDTSCHCAALTLPWVPCDAKSRCMTKWGLKQGLEEALCMHGTANSDQDKEAGYPLAPSLTWYAATHMAKHERGLDMWIRVVYGWHPMLPTGTDECSEDWTREGLWWQHAAASLLVRHERKAVLFFSFTMTTDQYAPTFLLQQHFKVPQPDITHTVRQNYWHTLIWAMGQTELNHSLIIRGYWIQRKRWKRQEGINML